MLYYNMDKVRKMTEQNRMRYIIRQVKHALNTSQDIERARWLIVDWYENDMCRNCIHEDFGYCGLRSSLISDNEMCLKFCFNSFLKSVDRLK